jgi:hypothetical protein
VSQVFHWTWLRKKNKRVAVFLAGVTGIPLDMAKKEKQGSSRFHRAFKNRIHYTDISTVHGERKYKVQEPNSGRFHRCSNSPVAGSQMFQFN